MNQRDRDFRPWPSRYGRPDSVVVKLHCQREKSTRSWSFLDVSRQFSSTSRRKRAWRGRVHRVPSTPCRMPLISRKELSIRSSFEHHTPARQSKQQDKSMGCLANNSGEQRGRRGVRQIKRAVLAACQVAEPGPLQSQTATRIASRDVEIVCSMMDDEDILVLESPRLRFCPPSALGSARSVSWSPTSQSSRMADSPDSKTLLGSQWCRIICPPSSLTGTWCLGLRRIFWGTLPASLRSLSQGAQPGRAAGCPQPLPSCRSRSCGSRSLGCCHGRRQRCAKVPT